MSIILFFAVLFVLIFIHELGHFLVAKKMGMRVDEFGMGLPPKLWSKKWRGTEYSINLLPIGGFIKIAGENGSDEPLLVDKTTVSQTNDTFSSKSKWAQVAVLIAGVTMNVIFAWILFVAVFIVGVPNIVDENYATADAALTVVHIMEDGPAEHVGLPLMAEIINVSTEETEILTLTTTSFREFTSENVGTQIYIEYIYEDILSKVSITPEIGLIQTEPNRAAVGIALAMVETVQLSIPVAMWNATQTTITSIGAITVGITTFIIDSVRGTADFSQISGPVGVVVLVGEAAEFGWASLFMLTAFISLNLAIINLLPFPALDGGRLIMVGIEAVTRRPINRVLAGYVNLIGFALLIVLMLVVTWNDIGRLF